MATFESYNVDELSIVLIAPIEESFLKIKFRDDEGYFSIVEGSKKVYNDIFTGKEYRILNDCQVHYIEKHINDYYIKAIEPFRKYMDDKFQKYVNEEEIKEVYNKIELEYQIANNSEGPLLKIKQIKEAIEKISSDDTKKIYLRKLLFISDNYTKSIIDNHNSMNKRNQKFKDRLIKETIKELNSLEKEINEIIRMIDYNNLLQDELLKLDNNEDKVRKI